MNASWRRLTTSRKKVRNEEAQTKLDNQRKLVAYVMIEMLTFYDEVEFLDEFFVWNNEKNGKFYSWFFKNEEAYMEQPNTD